MIFNMVGAMGKKPFLPQFTGKAKLVLLGDGSAGYMEFYTSGTLTWLGDKRPSAIDAFCVGGGGGGANTRQTTDGAFYGGGGGAGGYTSKGLSKALPASLLVSIGAGGAGATGWGMNTGSDGGNTSIGSLCTANGGGGGGRTDSRDWMGSVGGTGGSAGGNGGRGYHNSVSSLYRGGTGGADGGDAINTHVGHSTDVGSGQGFTTADLLGRKHAAGGGGGGGFYGTGPNYYFAHGAGGVSDFVDGSGDASDSHPSWASQSRSTASGGGGYGGGGAGGCASRSSGSEPAGAFGGQGFAMIAWGNYSAAIVA